VAETHTALLFFTADRVYKVKKPLDLSFVDYTTRSARWTACEHEVELNRRFAPDVYLGLAELHGPGEEGPEPIVVMRRMPDGRRLSHLIAVGAPVDEALDQVARLLAACHAGARHDSEVAAQGTRDAFLSRWEASFAELERLDGTVLDPATTGEIEHRARRYLAGRKQLFDSRIAQGRVVDGHGDLLAQDIFCLDDGPRVLDCLEFDDRLRYVDGLDDAAFLAMDLEQLGAPKAADAFLARYREYSGDPAPPSLWHHCIAYRAFVRAKVSLIQAAQGAPGAAPAAQRLASAALRHLRASAVRLVLVGGLPGSGKTTVSGALADRLGAVLLSTDRLRKEIVGIPPEQPAPAAYGTGLYTAEARHHTYEVMLDRARALLEVGESVVLDATWTSAAERTAAVEAAEQTSADLVPLYCRAPQELARSRLAHRPPGASDAGPEVAATLAEQMAPWPQATSIDTGGPVRDAVDRAMAVVLPDETATPVYRPSYMEPG
jgi:aminoglycoside phosphotransferase family enzyme/predicted kinase